MKRPRRGSVNFTTPTTQETNDKRRKRGFKLQRVAKEWERAFLEKQQGTPDMTFQALYDIYMEDMGHRLRPDTLKSMENVFKNHMLPHIDLL